MGLDAVEMVMAVEEAFDIRIDDAEAEKVVTPRMLIDCVLSKVAVATSAACLTQRAFNLFRKALLRSGGLKRSDIAPGTPLSILIPKAQRGAAMEKFAADMGIKDRPGLIRPNWLTAALFGASVVVGLFAAFSIPVSRSSQVLMIFPCVAALERSSGLENCGT